LGVQGWSLNIDLQSLSIERESFTIDHESLMIDRESFIIDHESFIIDHESFIIERESLMIERESFMLDAQRFMRAHFQSANGSRLFFGAGAVVIRGRGGAKCYRAMALRGREAAMRGERVGDSCSSRRGRVCRCDGRR
jgi:hypothetical protein